MKTAERIGDWIPTFTGRIFWPCDPRPDEVHIEDIAHALSQQCRFSGHCREFYSVADHSYRVSLLVSQERALWGLLHDAAEAYLVDLPRPIKHWCEMGRLYREMEATVMVAICIRFGLSNYEPLEVEKADNVMLATEIRDLVHMPPKPWDPLAAPLMERIIPRSGPDAEQMFLERFRRLTE